MKCVIIERELLFFLESNIMKIAFLGAAGEVTGSRYLLEKDDTKLLVDCGLFQGGKKLRKRNWDPFPIDPHKIDAIVITHAHIDHIGYIPLLIKNGFKGKIYCSKATYALCAILLLDSGAIQEEDAKKYNKEGSSDHSPALPLYTVADAENSLKYFQTVGYDEVFTVGGSLNITLICSGHILGASFVVVSDDTETVTFSGDLGRPDLPIMKSPPHIKETDYLILESTYGNRLHKDADPMKVLGDIVSKTVAQGGIVIIPAFAVGRTQMILYYLYQLKEKKVIPDIPIYLDSPMAISVTDLFCQFSNEHKLSSSLCAKVFDDVIYTRNVKESKKLDRLKRPAVIISGSGMADGGRVADHFKQYIPHAQNTVIFVGYQAKETRGRALIEGAKDIKIRGKSYPVHAAIKKINSLSAHADYDEILEWLSYFEKKPKKVFLTHGEIESALALQKKIEERFGWSVVIPKYLDSFDLD